MSCTDMSLSETAHAPDTHCIQVCIQDLFLCLESVVTPAAALQLHLDERTQRHEMLWSWVWVTGFYQPHNP